MDNRDIKILLVDDEVNFTILLKKVLVKKGIFPIVENEGMRAKERVLNQDFDIIISDLQMPDVDGMELLKSKNDDTLFIMITGYGSIDSAVKSMKIGAFDYINKPFGVEEFSKKVDRAIDRVKLKYNTRKINSGFEETGCFDNTIVGMSKKMQNVYTMIENVSQSDANVLIDGQSGTGKELVARSIHRRSTRKNGPFIAVNCSAIPDNLIESELFGHARGAYTGAIDKQKGVFELAHGGTLMLDEIAEMPYNLQSKLLRVIETWEVKPLGSDRIKKTDVRLICATNQNIRQLIEEKKFREDLFYRISTITIHLPSLSERKDDIPLLVNHFLNLIGKKSEKKYSIDVNAMELLVNHKWAGNVRELENAIERAIVTSETESLDKMSFRFLSDDSDEYSLNINEDMDLKELEKKYIRKVLDENGWNKLQAASLLGIDRKTLYNKIRMYKLE